jgi:hypothetical protein
MQIIRSIQNRLMKERLNGNGRKEKGLDSLSKLHFLKAFRVHLAVSDTDDPYFVFNYTV